MKKSVILLIGIIYIVSIVVVTFFGMQISMDQFKVYMSSVSLYHSDMQILDDNTKYLDIVFDDEKASADGYISVFVDYEVGPDNASYPALVTFSLTNNTYTDSNGDVTTYAEVSANGEVVFFQRRTVWVYIRTTDGSNLSDRMMIRCH